MSGWHEPGRVRAELLQPPGGVSAQSGGTGEWDASGSTHPPCTPAGSTTCLQRTTPAAREPWRYLRPRHPVWQTLICARHVVPQPGAREPACRGARVAAMSSQKLSITWVPGQRREAESSAAAGVKELALRGVSRHWDLWGWAGGLVPNPPDSSDGVVTPHRRPGTSWGQPYPSGPAPPRYHLTPCWLG